MTILFSSSYLPEYRVVHPPHAFDDAAKMQANVSFNFVLDIILKQLPNYYSNATLAG
jgi:hypothetical protein